MATRSPILMPGALSRYAAGFAEELVRQGYSKRTTANQLALVGRLSRWLDRAGLDASAVSVAVLDRFLCSEAETSRRWKPTVRSFVPLMDYLRGVGAVLAERPRVTGTPVEELLGRYGRYLAEERGLATTTISHYDQAARQLLLQRPMTGDQVDLTGLSLAEVTAFVARETQRLSSGSARNLVSALRALLRYLHLEGLITQPLASGLPSAACWSGSTLPRALPPGQAARLLDSCDRRRAVGRRDYAILTLLVRLGLRAGEVAALRLDEIDWRAGEIAVQGKGRRTERLPIPVDVGDALAGYLSRGRPRIDHRTVFIRAHAPWRGLTSNGVSDVVRAACARADLPVVGAHRLRHTAGTDMLRAGAPLSEVAQALRHQSHATTALYAKVDHIALRCLALPWPGAR